MDGKVRVLLVSAGASPDALVAELERLGVEIAHCPFAEAEEQLETNPPDLVALAGALGAIELANIIDDLDDGPRMVIVAERKELAKLRGLNREVVVSLFAMETTEKVVGQRIESLARRAARRRDQKAAPEPAPAKKTALGLPTAAQVGKLDLKKKEPPPRAAQAVAMEETPPSSGNHPGAEPEAPAPRPAERPEAVVEKAEARPEPPEHAPARRPAPPRPPSLENLARAAAEESIQVIDDDLLESILPDAPDGDIPEISAIPMMSAAPDPADAPVSHPPTLPPAAKAQAQGSQLKDVSLKVPPGELDIEGAEDALENLDSVKLEITQDLVDQAQKEMSAKAEAEAESVPEERAEDSPAPDRGAFPDVGSRMAMDKTMPLMASPLADEMDGADLPSLASDEAKEDPAGEETKEASEAELELEGPSAEEEAAVADAGEPEIPQTREEEPFEEPAAEASMQAAEPLPEPSPTPAGVPGKKRGGGGTAVGLLAVVALLAGGAYAVKSGMLGGAAPKKEPPATAAPKKDPADPQETSNDEAANAKGQEAEPAATAEGEDAPPSEAAEEAENAAEADGDGSEAAAVAPTSALANPFKREDTKKPSCDSILVSNKPEPGKDPVHEASMAWEEARGAIVRGKLEKAHELMCQAVSLNPESAAVEGLAAHYLSLGSYAEALAWVEKADALRPGQRDMGNLRGDIYGMMGDIDKARQIWLETLNIGPDEQSRLGPISKDYSVEAGRHLRRGDYVRAELFFRRAVILDPENITGIIGLAKVYHRLEMPAYAKAFCEMSLKVSDVIPEVHVLLGELALAEGDKQGAKDRFERALAVRPGFFPAKRGLSQVK